MVKLDRIKIKGFKSIKEADIPLTNLNVLIGANGSGKSNFISFFKLLNTLSDKKDGTLKSFVKKYGGASKFLYFGHKVTDLIDVSIDIKKNEIKTTHSFGLKWALGDILEEDKGYGIVSDEPIPEDTFFSFNNFFAYHFNDTGLKSPIKLQVNVNDNEYLKPDASNLSAYLYLIQQKHPENFKHIVKSIQLVAPYIKDFKLRLDPLTFKSVFLEWKHKNNDELYFEIEDFSDGTLRFICLATLLLQPNPPATIIIDEPELGLHPYAITILSALIKQASVDSQIIIATQSTRLVDKFTPKDIIVVDRENDASVFKRLNDEEWTNWLEDYSLGELWEKNVFGGRP